MKIDHNSFKIDSEKQDIRFYVKRGDQEYIDDEENYRVDSENNNVCAKAVRNKFKKSFRKDNTQDFSYFIKTTPNKIIYNPFQKHTIENNIPKNYIDKICKSELVFSQVTFTTFTKYLDFLRNGSIKKLQDIQRDIK